VLSTAAVVGMSVTALLLALTPGPNMIYLLSRSIGQGRRAGMVSLGGTGLGFVIYLAMANLGLSVVFLAVPWLYIGFKLAGAGYIAYLAWQTLRPGGADLFDPTQLKQDSRWRLFRTGLVTNLLNPKAAILYLALIPPFVDPHRGHPTVQGFALGTIQITISMIVNAGLVLAAAGIARFMTSRPEWGRWQRRITGSLLAAVALVLLREAPAHART
jgi:threonine/homoserine/homoserine lactone efflux protein